MVTPLFSGSSYEMINVYYRIGKHGGNNAGGESLVIVITVALLPGVRPAFRPVGSGFAFRFAGSDAFFKFRGA